MIGGKFKSAAKGAKSKYQNAVKDNDRGYKALKREFEKLGRAAPTVKVGILGDATENQRTDGTLSNVEIGTIQEFGAGNVPERSFLRSTMDEKGGDYRRLMANGLRQAFGQKGAELEASTERVLNLVGMKAAADVKNKIRAGIAPENAPSTIAAKGSSTPLVDTGQLLNSISWQVTKGGAK